jgi:tetratricopeptide (TPR) repeat protein
MALYSMGNCQYVMDNYSDALVSQLSALQIFDSLGNQQEKGHLLSQIASIQAYTGSYELAYQYYQMAMEVFEAIHDTNSFLQSIYDLGHAYLQQGDTMESETMFRRRLRILGDESTSREKAYTCEALGLCYTGRDLDSALYYFDTAEQIWNVFNTHFVGLGGFGRLYLLKAEAYHAAGPEYFEKTLAFYQKCHDFSWLGSNQLMVRLLCGMADLYYNTEKYDSAFLRLDGAYYLCSNYLDKINHHFYGNLNEKMEDEIYLKSYMEKIYRLYYNLYTVLDNKDKAFEYYKKATQWSDSIFNQQNSRQWAMLQGQYETDRARGRISELEKDNEMKSMAVRQSRIYLVVLGVIAFLILLIGLLFIRQNRMQTQHRTLILEQKLMRVQMNPHFIFNSLADLQGFIWSKDPATSNEYLSSFSKLLRLILENSRQEFVPVEREVAAVTNYLKLQSFRYKDKFDYSIEIDETIDEEAFLIPPMLSQPFIENSIEHGIQDKETKGHISFEMKLDHDVISIRVTDDGIGFKGSMEKKSEKYKDHESLAMKITQERLVMLGKKYRKKLNFEMSDIIDANDKIIGARVSIDVPYQTI